MLDIPVVGLGEASMLYAMQLGRRFGLVSIDPICRRSRPFNAKGHGPRPPALQPISSALDKKARLPL